MLRVGVMVNSFTGDAWTYRLMEDIQRSGFAQIALVICDTPGPRPVNRSLVDRLKSLWRGSLYWRYQANDAARNRVEDDSLAETDFSPLLGSLPTLKVVPLREGFTDRFREEDVEAIRAADLDVIFRFGFRIVRGSVLGAARYGVWSYHHDDNRAYRGGPPLFWEVYDRNPVSGTILQILTETLDGGKVIYRSYGATRQTSLYLNRVQAYWKGAEFAMRRLRDLHTHGFGFIEALPTYNEADTNTWKMCRTPNALQMLKFLGGQVIRRVSKSARDSRRGTRRGWMVGIRPRNVRAFDDTGGYRLVVPPRDRYYADPILFERGGKQYVFFEDFRYAEGRGHISCVELAADGSPGEPVDVLKCPYHLSYPFVFEHGGEVFMIPESNTNETVELYRATNFPLQWEHAGDLLRGVNAVDATIHEENGKLWMMVGQSNGRYTMSEELCIYYADHLMGPWTPHPANPVVSDVRVARPAGPLFRENGKLIRPSQDCSVAYGWALNFSEIVTLTETQYEEWLISKVTPEWIPDGVGIHTYSRTSAFEAIDANR